MKVGDKVRRIKHERGGDWTYGDQIVTIKAIGDMSIQFHENDYAWRKDYFEPVESMNIRDRISQLEKEVEQLKKELSTEKEKATVGSKWKFTKYGPDKTSIYIVAQILDQYVLVNIDNGLCWTDKCKTIPEVFGTHYREYFEPA